MASTMPSATAASVFVLFIAMFGLVFVVFDYKFSDFFLSDKAELAILMYFIVYYKVFWLDLLFFRKKLPNFAFKQRCLHYSRTLITLKI